MRNSDYVPDQITPVAAADVIRDMFSAASLAFCKDVSPETVAVLTAHSALETGRWKSMHNWNFGNVKASASWAGLFTCFRCNEIINGKVEWFNPSDGGYSVPPGHPQTRFRAFTSLETGLVSHLTFLTTKRYIKALDEALRGDPNKFCSELKSAGYFTAALAPYVRAVSSLFDEYLPAVHAYHNLSMKSLSDKPSSGADIEIVQSELLNAPNKSH